MWNPVAKTLLQSGEAPQQNESVVIYTLFNSPDCRYLAF